MAKFKNPHALRVFDAALWMGSPADESAMLEAADEFERTHRRYEYVRRLSVPEFQAIFNRCLKGERFDDVIDACIAGCPPRCREDNYPGCAHCMSPR